jgi:protein-L-isoaspartate O-methyltransferase
VTSRAMLEEAEYRPFPNEEGRNSRQTQWEIPVLVKALGLPRDARILEVGCGRGIALPVLDRLCSPRRLAGLDIDEELLMEAAAIFASMGPRRSCTVAMYARCRSPTKLSM